ncbi:MAG: YdiU family protein [Colwellia sp.]|nr:YdiU family protein [Colwellia sp.]
MKFLNTYINLGEQFFQRTLPQKVASPTLLLWNKALADNLLISENLQKNHSLLAQYFSGNQLLNGAESIALAYSGHQFGHFNPQLGDGRAHLLGEVLDNDNIRRDIQLKGSGQTGFSRRGDGKCALAPALREYIMSEALFALGVPTSRCLSVVATGEIVNRGLVKAGAVVTRVAASHIRVGTFQYFAARGDTASLRLLVDYSIKRHFPEIDTDEKGQNISLSFEQRIIAFLASAITKQITLVVEWLRIGFIHGVMNTDNTAICGETLDFGPCAMLGEYNQSKVFSSIDEYGRYAFGNQGKIAQWNMARLADCLIPLLIEDGDKELTEEEQEQQALTKVETLIHQYTDKFETAYFTMYGNKLGMKDTALNNKPLITDLLTKMQTQKLDYTQTFLQLTQSLTDGAKAQKLASKLGDWYQTWLVALDQEKPKQENSQQDSSQQKISEKNSYQQAQSLMRKNNPVVIPRNHHIEVILESCENAIANDLNGGITHSKKEVINDTVSELLEVLLSPYQETEMTKKYQDIPEDGDRYYQTFCGT